MLFSGGALILIGFFGIAIDLIHNWKIEEYSSFTAVFLGAAILLATTVVYVILPEYKNYRRMGMLRQYYTGSSEGDIKNINHAIMERSQGIVTGTEMLAELSHVCDREDVTREECNDKILTAKKMLGHIDNESTKLRELLDKLDDYVKVKKYPDSKR